MKYRRRPIVRDVVDAIKGETHYLIEAGGGSIIQTPHEEFEHDYEPVKRERVPKARKPRKSLGVLTQPAVGKPQ